VNTLLEGKRIFDLVLPPEKVKKCLSRMSGKLSRTVLRRGRESNLSSLVEFTSHDFQKVLTDQGVKISMDGKGRALDNIAIERFWRTLKYGEIYLKEYQNTIEAVAGIGKYIEKYNSRRPHTTLDDKTPDEAYSIAG
jgi:transposase InsO family protein